MEKIFCISFSCLFLIPGVLLSLLNWGNICIWVWEKWRNPRRWREDCIVPFLGGLCLLGGLSILAAGVPELFVSLLQKLGWSDNPHVISALAAGLGLLIDYGSIPHLIITPLLGFILHLREKPAPKRKPRGPYCRQLQLTFPLLLVGEDEIPQLISAPSELPKKNADFLLEAPGSTLYTEGLCQKVVRVHSLHKPNLWNRLRHRNDENFWAVEVEYTPQRTYGIKKLLNQMARLVRADDDVWTQFHEAHDLLQLLKNCTTFAEFLALGSLAGWWSESASVANLPSLKEDDITQGDIYEAARNIVFK